LESGEIGIDGKAFLPNSTMTDWDFFEEERNEKEKDHGEAASRGKQPILRRRRISRSSRPLGYCIARFVWLLFWISL